MKKIRRRRRRKGITFDLRLLVSLACIFVQRRHFYTATLCLTFLSTKLAIQLRPAATISKLLTGANLEVAYTFWQPFIRKQKRWWWWRRTWIRLVFFFLLLLFLISTSHFILLHLYICCCCITCSLHSSLELKLKSANSKQCLKSHTRSRSWSWNKKRWMSQSCDCVAGIMHYVTLLPLASSSSSYLLPLVTC